MDLENCELIEINLLFQQQREQLQKLKEDKISQVEYHQKQLHEHEEALQRHKEALSKLNK